jgi:hypothetical protein
MPLPICLVAYLLSFSALIYGSMKGWEYLDYYTGIPEWLALRVG